jgi:hypothetical protein
MKARIGLAMDPFLETFWNLDQVHGWAETRDPDYVRAAALPRYGVPKKTVAIAIPMSHSPTPLLRGQRDIEAELWATSGWEPKIANFVPSKDFQEYAEQRGLPVWQAHRYRDIAVIFPLDPPKRSLGHAWKIAPERERALMVEITFDHHEDASGILTDARLDRLTPKLVRLLREAVVAPSVQGPPHVFLRERFRTLDYLRHLFEQARLHAVANRPSDPEAKVISTIDWSGLIIAVGGDDERLSVWMRGSVGTKGPGAYENVRVPRADVLREFPAEPSEDEDVEPAAVSDEQVREVVRTACDMNGGFVGQEEGASLVREKFPNVRRDRARKLVREVTGNDKPGPKRPRRQKQLTAS